MSRIDRLTPEQEARFTHYARKWTDIGLCTDPADRPRAEAGIHECYQIAGLKPPEHIVWCGSPLSMALTRASVGASVRDSVGDSVGASVRDSVGDSVGASVWASVYGQHDASWLSFYDFFAREAGLKSQTDKLAGLWAVAQSAGWWLPHEKICWVSERTSIVRQDDNKRLHCDNGPAVAYPDGWAIHAWHGTRVPGYVIERPLEITIGKIHAQQNAEIRYVMMERFGTDRYIREAGAREIHRDVDDLGNSRILYHIDMPDAPPIARAHVICSSTGKNHFLKVRPEYDTVDAAVAATFGLKPESYQMVWQA